MKNAINSASAILATFCILSFITPSTQFVPSVKSSCRQEICFDSSKGNRYVQLSSSSTPASSDTTSENDTNDNAIKSAKEATFEDAQVLGQKLATILTESCSNGEEMPEEATRILRALVSTTSGARGWFVSLLTNPDYDAIFTQPKLDTSLLQAICDNPEPNIRLMTMNVAMSTAMELVHLRMNNNDLAAGSRMTRDRSRIIVEALIGEANSESSDSGDNFSLPGLREELLKLRSAVEPWVMDDNKKKEVPPMNSDAEWVKFTKKWGYNSEQRAAILEQLDQIL